MRGLLRFVLASLLLPTCIAWAAQPDRIAATIDGTQTVILKGSVHPLAQSKFDRGLLEPSTRLPYVTLVVQPSAAQQAALKTLLAEQQDPASPNYHHWLTPEEFGQRFGLSNNDLKSLAGWLRSQGFSIAEVARGRNWIAISGTVDQVQRAFRTQIHRYNVESETRFANATELSVPKALQGVIGGVRGLDNFKMKPQFVKASAVPDYTYGSSNHVLAPDDIATIYDIGPLYSNSINGTGMKIAIMGQTDIHITDIEQFRSGFNLSTNDPTQVLATGCTDPGYTGDEPEADLDLEWSGAVAKDASIIYVKCDTNSNSGVVTSLQYAVNNNTAPVISMSYGLCESSIGSAYLEQSYEPMIVQANSQGQTLMVSSGDSGSAGCDAASSNQATQGLAVNGLASPPEVTAVGGTEFNEGSGSYWNSSNGSNGGSAKSYIPELAWDDSNSGTSLNGGGLVSTGGGASIYFSKPSWQTGPGTFNSTFRSVPDVAMPASADHDGYIFCSQGSCASGIAQAVANNSIVGGTSVASPVFAGIVALLNQQLGNTPPAGVGNMNTTLYSLAQKSSNAFHDVLAGNYNISGATSNPSGNEVPCKNPSTNCPTSAPFQIGFLTGTGYDEVTGLGSVDAYNFATSWSGAVTATPTTTSIGALSAINVGTKTVTLTATVKPTSGSGTPTGTVTFSSNGTQIGNAAKLSSGKATVSYSTGSLVVGSYAITAVYNPSGNAFASSNGAGSLAVQDFQTPTANPATVTITAPGQTGSSTITITPGSTGFNQAVTFSCSSLPSEASCTFSPTSVTPGSSATTTTITISTTAASGSLRETPFGRTSGIFFAMLFPGFLGVISAGSRRRAPRGIRALGLIAVLAMASIWFACGGGSSSSSAPKNLGTPVGSSSVTITATSGTVVHTVPLMVTIQ